MYGGAGSRVRGLLETDLGHAVMLFATRRSQTVQIERHARQTQDRRWYAAAGTLATMPKLTYVCVLTRRMERLAAFYEAVLDTKPPRSRPGYIEFDTRPGIFSLWSLDDFERTIGSTLTDAFKQGRVMLEFDVDDVDAEYTRLRNLPDQALEFVMAPKDLPWGNRSFYFRDPDGNVIDFFTPIRH